MDENFLKLNKHLDSVEEFRDHDPDLSKLKQLPFIYHSPLLTQLPTSSGIYTLIGGGMTGKTTLLKQWIEKLLLQGVPAQRITFYKGDLLANYKSLISFLQLHLENNNELPYLLIDEIMDVSGWEKAIKFAADLGWLDNVILMLTSANANLSKAIEAMFPNRKNEKKLSDFYLYSLSFRESIVLQHPQSMPANLNLYEEFNNYLLHGGYLPAINELASHGKILTTTLQGYTNWLRKEITKYGKQDNFLLEMIGVILKNYNKPLTWNALTHELSINHPKTIGDYVSLLESLNVVFVQHSLLEQTLTKAPKKARKLIFTDPFIFHALRTWHNLTKDPFEAQIKPILHESELCAEIVKACATSHFSRFYPTYYIKAEGDIDLAYIYDDRFWPILVTWTNQLNTKDLKQILKYPNGKILTKAQRSGIIEHIRTEPLPQALWRLEEKE